ncbi:MAG TPA: protein kinase, partial [Kofleriaceae bacterium]|nr:protein kinase [Kofleriaceae bacterium]
MGESPIGAGQRFGRYQLVERLAVGGMAELFIATSPGEHGFQKKVVIKRLLPHLVADETYNAMFIDEAKLTARLVHPKIAQTFELGKVDDALFIAMEYIDGIDVLAVLREYAAKRRRVEPRLAAWIAHETLDALDYAHNVAGEDGKPLGIVHRDISPSNVLLSARGDVKLVDFGIARAKDPDRAHKSKSGTLKGKYGYMSPEQVIELQLDARSDVFSVGIVLAELLTGRRLFAAANELDVLLMVRDAKLARFEKYGADLEPGLAEIVRKALKKPLDERWSSAAAFRDALSEWLFEHRYRITPKQIADIVVELRDAVNERRNKTIGVPANDEEIAVSRAPSEDAPILIIDAEPSVPVIQIEPEPPDEPGKRAVTASELIASTPHPAPKRALPRLVRRLGLDLDHRHARLRVDDQDRSV